MRTPRSVNWPAENYWFVDLCDHACDGRRPGTAWRDQQATLQEAAQGLESGWTGAGPLRVTFPLEGFAEKEPHPKMRPVQIAAAPRRGPAWGAAFGAAVAAPIL